MGQMRGLWVLSYRSFPIDKTHRVLITAGKKKGLEKITLNPYIIKFYSACYFLYLPHKNSLVDLIIYVLIMHSSNVIVLFVCLFFISKKTGLKNDLNNFLLLWHFCTPLVRKVV